MTEENKEQVKEQVKEYPTAEKQMFAAGVPFQVVNKTPKDNWRSNYAFYLKQKADGGSLRPLLGRMKEEQFQVYEDGSWVDKHLWNDYSYEEEVNGKKRKRLYFDHKFDFLMKFENPIAIEYWDKDSRQKVTEQHETCWVRLSKSNMEKLLEQVEDPRSPEGSWFIIEYDKTKAPADQYKIKFHHMKE